MINLVKRYIVATTGLMIVALGVALSLKSNLGTAPVSCPPAMLNLKFDKTGRGILGVTFLWAVVFLAAQFLL